MKTQTKHLASPAGLLVIALLAVLGLIVTACRGSDPCPKKTMTCSGLQPGETFRQYEIELVNQRTGCGNQDSCVWANDRAEAESCRLSQQLAADGWRLHPSGLGHQPVPAACHNLTGCCQTHLTVLASSAAEAERCLRADGWIAVDPRTVEIRGIEYTCEGHGSVGTTPTSWTVLSSVQDPVSARNLSDAKRCVFWKADQEALVRENNLTVTCDFH